MIGAANAARERGAGQIGTEHILLGLLRLGKGLGVGVLLERLGADLTEMLAALGKALE